MIIKKQYKRIGIGLDLDIMERAEPYIKKGGAKVQTLLNQLLEDWVNKQEFINVLLSDPKIKFSNKTLSGKN